MEEPRYPMFKQKDRVLTRETEWKWLLEENLKVYEYESSVCKRFFKKYLFTEILTWDLLYNYLSKSVLQDNKLHLQLFVWKERLDFFSILACPCLFCEGCRGICVTSLQAHLPKCPTEWAEGKLKPVMASTQWSSPHDLAVIKHWTWLPFQYFVCNAIRTYTSGLKICNFQGWITYWK